MQAEAKIKKYEEDLATVEDSNQKSAKEKKMMEERLSDVSATLAEEEEKAKHLSKLKAKHESTIGELEEKLRKDNQQRQEVERAKRKIETELNDLKEQVGEKKMHVSFSVVFALGLWMVKKLDFQSLTRNHELRTITSVFSTWSTSLLLYNFKSMIAYGRFVYPVNFINLQL